MIFLAGAAVLSADLLPPELDLAMIAR
jgi:hypothetical protein